MNTFLAMALAYVIGSLPTGLWIGRYVRGVDIREFGSGNLGATNAFRVLGSRLGMVVLLGDVLKGLLPVIFLPRIFGFYPPSPGQELLIGGSAILGHVLSMFVNFKGGKGVATALGVFLAIVPAEMFSIFLLALLIIVVTGYVSLAAIVAAILLPIVLYFTDAPPVTLVISSILSFIVIVRHRGNIERLLDGRENRLTDMSEKFLKRDG